MNKTRPFKNNCYNCLINYIPETMRKSFGDFKDKIVTQTQLNNSCLGKERN